MFEFLKPHARGVSTLSVVLGAAAMSMGAHAQSTSSTGADQAESMAAPVADGQIVARDRETGKLRPANAEEMQLLQRHRTTLRAARMESRTHWSGATGARLTDEFMSYSVVVKRADGKLVELCVDGADGAAKVVAAPGVATSVSLPTE